ncbi:MAG: disulfide bond formation protein B [bacterium]
MLQAFNTFVGIGTLATALVVVSIWLLVFLQETENTYFHFLKKHSFHFAFLLALSAIIGSLTYSQIFGFPPCTFCWWQRIFMYPQAILFAVGIYLKDMKVWITGIILSLIGASFSIYHILLQAGIRTSGVPCEASGGVACTKIDVLVFGWLTIPMMCLVLFIGILTFAYISHRKQA